MRVLGFSKRWQKLSNPEFTTFRFTRKDRDWWTGEIAQIVYKPRSKEREILGIAQIVKKETRRIFKVKQLYGHKLLDTREARKDGFMGWGDMALWLTKTYGHKRLGNEVMNKLTLRWVSG